MDVLEQAGQCSRSHRAMREYASELGSSLVLFLQAAYSKKAVFSPFYLQTGVVPTHSEQIKPFPFNSLNLASG